MLAGARPFAGNTAPEVMSAILRDEPSPLTVPDGGDGRLESIVRRCLEKRPEHRFQSARDLAFALETLAGAASPAAVPAAGSRRPSSGRRRVAALLLGAAIVTGGFLLYSAWRPKATETTALTPIRALAVLPFANVSGDPAQEYFAEGFTDELTTTLADFSALKVIARTSAASYKGTDKRAARIGQELGVDGLISGSVLRSGDRVRITAQLVSTETETNLWAKSYERGTGDVLALQAEVARAIANAIAVRLSPEETARLAAPSLDAARNFGRHGSRHGGLHVA
jgi:TolB-like protein